jgi:hypothetical protein
MGAIRGVDRACAIRRCRLSAGTGDTFGGRENDGRTPVCGRWVDQAEILFEPMSQNTGLVNSL